MINDETITCIRAEVATAIESLIKDVDDETAGAAYLYAYNNLYNGTAIAVRNSAGDVQYTIYPLLQNLYADPSEPVEYPTIDIDAGDDVCKIVVGLFELMYDAISKVCVAVESRGAPIH